MRGWLPIVITLCVGCMPKASHTILVPADKELPNTIGSIAVENGTNIRTDALAALKAEIKASPRVTLVPSEGDPDAVITLKSIDVDNVTRDCNKESKESATASLTYDITFKWEMLARGDAPYDRYTMNDSGSMEKFGTDCGEAKSLLPAGQKDIAAAHDAWGIGEGYAHRIAPYKRRLTRKFYGGGNDNLVEARKKAKNDNWDGASEIWKKVAEDAADKKIKGRAQFNLAVYYERERDYDTAMEWIEKARKNLDNGLSKKYMNKLRFRQRRAKQSAGQMRPITGK